MNKLSHSKYKNTGIIFELLVRQLTNETMSNTSPKAVNIIKKFFTKTEIAKENKLYQTLIQSQSITESKAELTLSTIQDLYRNIDISKLNKEKYNLIKEIKDNYDLDRFFKTSISNYKYLASIYTLLESNNHKNISPSFLINSKSNVLEYLTEKQISSDNEIYREFSKMEKGERFLVYKIMLENFNNKYDHLDSYKKEILKDYIYNISDLDKLKEKINIKFKSIKKELNENLKKIDDTVIRVKISETIKMIEPIIESKKMKDEYISTLFQFQDLNEEINLL